VYWTVHNGVSDVDLGDKLRALAGAARYDASCASSGSRRGPASGRIGTSVPSGICHSLTEDGRCVSLLKVLLTNHCIYDCSYCVNRSSSDIPRAAFRVSELVDLTINFYRRNFIEGLFLSSGIMKSPDDTMERLIRVAGTLRLSHGFNGYIHLKCIPGAAARLVREAGLYADRLSVNIELPSETSLRRLASDKTYSAILDPMRRIRDSILENRDERKVIRSAPVFAPAGQSTQLIVGASPERDYEVLRLARDLYRSQGLRRIYYSAYVPVNVEDSRLPKVSGPPLRREHRLYQSDWLIRLYGFDLEDLLSAEQPDLDLGIDPKHAFALRHPELFPVDLNRADYEQILRVPGIGLQSARRIVAMRRERSIRFENLSAIGVVVRRAAAFIRCPGLEPGGQGGRSSSKAAPSGCSHLEPVPPGSRTVLVHDGSFDGLLTAIFETYERKVEPDAVVRKGFYQARLSDRCIRVETDPTKAERVWRRLGALVGDRCAQALFSAFLSGEPEVDRRILEAVRGAVARERGGVEEDLRERLRELEAVGVKVRREARRMRGFVRFERALDDLYVAFIAPRYDVLPLILEHFERRYGDQRWIIYDTSRDYGCHFDAGESVEIRLPRELIHSLAGGRSGREDYGALWKQYFDAVSIPERKNTALHLKNMPRRTWRFMPEKRPAVRQTEGRKSL